MTVRHLTFSCLSFCRTPVFDQSPRTHHEHGHTPVHAHLSPTKHVYYSGSKLLRMTRRGHPMRSSVRNAGRFMNSRVITLTRSYFGHSTLHTVRSQLLERCLLSEGWRQSWCHSGSVRPYSHKIGRAHV